MRYIHKICDKDYSLVNGMIPLGSCTMKLNAAAVMTPITFPGLCESTHLLQKTRLRATQQ